MTQIVIFHLSFCVMVLNSVLMEEMKSLGSALGDYPVSLFSNIYVVNYICSI